MKSILVRQACLLAIGLSLCGLGAACHKQSTAESSSTAWPSLQHLPDATNVTAAFDQKDYENAVGALAKLKESATSEDQLREFQSLTLQLQTKLTEAAATDPKATEALHALGFVVTGR